tara:strand:- start:4013 stop:4333 length:321 start_codon:yes stop_codon:yes gene_type:complete
MANNISAAKKWRRNQKNKSYNKSYKTKYKTSVINFNKTIKNYQEKYNNLNTVKRKELDQNALYQLSCVFSAADKAHSRGYVGVRWAARRKSRALLAWKKVRSLIDF